MVGRRRGRALRWSWFLAALVMAGVPAGAGAQDDDAGDEAGEDVAITRLDTSQHPRVEIEVSISRTAVPSPRSSDITVTENGRRVPFTITRVPSSELEVVLLIDTSGSMNDGNAIEQARQAALAFVDEMPDDVQIGVVSFDSSPALVSPMTGDREFLRAAIAGLSAAGNTALYDSIVFGATLFSGGTDDRQIILLSDGGDTFSTASLEQALDVASAIRVSVIELITEDTDRAVLEQLAAAANGTMSSADDPEALERLFRDAASGLVSRYRLTTESAATGVLRYDVRVQTPTGVATASTSVIVQGTSTATTTTSPSTTAPSAIESPENDAGAAAASPISSERQGGSSTWMLIVGAGLVFLVLTWLIVSALSGARRTARTGASLEPAAREALVETPSGLGERVSGSMERLLERRGRRGKLSDALEAAGMSLRPGEFVVVAIGFGLVLAVALTLLLDLFGLVIALVLVPILARVYLQHLTDKRRRAFAEQLPDWLQLLVSSLRAGLGLQQSLDSVSNQSAEPTSAELRRVLFEARIGRDLNDGLEAMAKRMDNREFDFVVDAIQINREIGGQLATVLDTIGETIRERQSLARQIRVLTAEGRLSIGVLTALPIFLVVLLSLVNRSYFEPMTKGAGPVLILVAVVLSFLGWAWMRRIVKAQE